MTPKFVKIEKYLALTLKNKICNIYLSFIEIKNDDI